MSFGDEIRRQCRTYGHNSVATWALKGNISWLLNWPMLTMKRKVDACEFRTPASRQ